MFWVSRCDIGSGCVLTPSRTTGAYSVRESAFIVYTIHTMALHFAQTGSGLQSPCTHTRFCQDKLERCVLGELEPSCIHYIFILFIYIFIEYSYYSFIYSHYSLNIHIIHLYIHIIHLLDTFMRACRFVLLPGMVEQALGQRLSLR